MIRKTFSPWWLNVGFCTWWCFELGCYFVYPWVLIKTWLHVMVFCGGCTHSLLFFLFILSIMVNRAWNILCWNIRGLNDKDKWDPIRNKIEESCANIFCLQETKREAIDLQFI
jgi:hypothetical protein